jgi:hypothetical protein
MSGSGRRWDDLAGSGQMVARLHIKSEAAAWGSLAAPDFPTAVAGVEGSNASRFKSDSRTRRRAEPKGAPSAGIGQTFARQLNARKNRSRAQRKKVARSRLTDVKQRLVSPRSQKSNGCISPICSGRGARLFLCGMYLFVLAWPPDRRFDPTNRRKVLRE